MTVWRFFIVAFFEIIFSQGEFDMTDKDVTELSHLTPLGQAAIQDLYSNTDTQLEEIDAKFREKTDPLQKQIEALVAQKRLIENEQEGLVSKVMNNTTAIGEALRKIDIELQIQADDAFRIAIEQQKAHAQKQFRTDWSGAGADARELLFLKNCIAARRVLDVTEKGPNIIPHYPSLFGEAGKLFKRTVKEFVATRLGWGDYIEAQDKIENFWKEKNLEVKGLVEEQLILAEVAMDHFTDSLKDFIPSDLESVPVTEAFREELENSVGNIHARAIEKINQKAKEWQFGANSQVYAYDQVLSDRVRSANDNRAAAIIASTGPLLVGAVKNVIIPPFIRAGYVFELAAAEVAATGIKTSGHVQAWRLHVKGAADAAVKYSRTKSERPDEKAVKDGYIKNAYAVILGLA
jgi:hypothetical protein